MNRKILFAADNHYGMHGGRVLYESIQEQCDISFYEDDWTCFTEHRLGAHDLLMLNLISGACDVPAPAPSAEAPVRHWLESGKPVFLLHGASAAFWQWSWWRALVGFRWVRENDPDGFAASTHPHQAYTVRLAKTRHPLCQQLQEVDIPEDELYINLEETCPTQTLMKTVTEYGAFPMCYETITPWNGRVVGYIPGHAAHVVRLPVNVANCRAIIDYLLGA